MKTSLLVRRRLLGGGFSPSVLFVGGEPGVWYDPSDLTTMFQDRAGTTPVTTPGQSVGLVLDKSKGLVLGPELVTNGTFDDATGWGLTGSGAISGGRFISGAAGDKAQQTLSATVANKTYLITLTGVVGSIGIRLGQDTSNQATFSADGSAYVVGASSTNILTLRASVSGAEVSSISVREIPGNHMVATADASRGTYGVEPFGGRRNLLTWTEQFENAAWVKQSVTVNVNADVAPDGTTTAEAMFETITIDAHQVRQTVTVLSGQSYAMSAYVKANGRTRGAVVFARASGSFDGFVVSFNLTTETVSVSVVGTGTCTSSGITPVGNGWYRVFGVGTIGAFTDAFALVRAQNDAGASNYAGDVTKGLFVWGAQLEVGSTATPYQRVTTAFDVTEAGVPTVHYVQFDGADDGYLTSTITPGTDKAQVFAGVRKLTDSAAYQVIVEHSPSLAANNGAFVLAPAVGTYEMFSKGTTQASASGSGFPAPITNVVTGLGDISGDRVTTRINGTQAAQATADQGTGNYLAYPLYIGRRGGATLPFNGRLYQMVVRFGPNLDAARIAQVERFMAGKTGFFSPVISGAPTIGVL